MEDIYKEYGGGVIDGDNAVIFVPRPPPKNKTTYGGKKWPIESETVSPIEPEKVSHYTQYVI